MNATTPRAGYPGGVGEAPPATDGLGPIREELRELLPAHDELAPERDEHLLDHFMDRLRSAINRELERRRVPSGRRLPDAWLVPLVAVAAGLPVLLVDVSGLFMVWLLLWAAALVLTIALR